MPGITRSPSPTMLVLKSPSAFRQGNTILMGISRFLATVTITSVPQTQKMSQKKRAQSRKRPVLVELRLKLFKATRVNRIAKILLRAQWRVTKQNPTGKAAPMIQIILAIESSNFLISRMFCSHVGICMVQMVLFCCSEKGSRSTKMPEMESTVVSEKQVLMIQVKISLGRYLQSRQKPKRKAEAQSGNCFASAILITCSSSPKTLEQFTTCPFSSLARRVERMQPMQTHAQELMSSCQKIGRTRSAPPTLAARMSAQAMVRFLTGLGWTVILSIYYHHVHQHQDFYNRPNYKHKDMIRALQSIKRVCLVGARQNRFGFGGLPASFLLSSQERNTEIISLNVEQIQQLSTISHYSNSVEFLRQNKLQDSLTQLEFALAESKNKYPWSINLQACLMNRMSILVKLLSKKQKFQSLLEELYLISLSSKGPRSLDTIKNLINYLICLTIHNQKKCNAVLDYISTEGLPDYVLFFDALNTIRQKGNYQEGLKKMQGLPQQFPYEKIFKYNNIAFMRMYCLKEQYKNTVEYPRQFRAQSKDILSTLLKALIQAQINHENQGQFSKEQNQTSQKLQQEIELYLKGERKQLPTDKISPKRILKHSNSHIISMNIASLLFQEQRLNECFYFLQLTLQKAIADNELERVGIALTLLGRCYYLQGEQKWEKTYLDLLEHTSTYPKAVVKQALSTYSRLLFQQGRYYQAEHYFNQALSMQTSTGIEGLILPSYDFSF